MVIISLIIVCMAIMGVLMILSVISGNDFTGVTSGDGVDVNAIVNGSTTDFVIDAYDATFSINAVEGAIIWFVVIGTIVAIFSFQVLGTGLSDVGVSTLRAGFFYGGVWGVLSVLTWDLVISIEIFGAIIYIVLTMLYVIGVFQKILTGAG